MKGYIRIPATEIMNLYTGKELHELRKTGKLKLKRERERNIFFVKK